MTVKSKKKLILTLLALFFISITAVLAKIIVFAKSDNITLSKELSDTYFENYRLEIPTAKVSLDSGEYEMDYMVVYPDGRKSSEAVVTLDVTGKYTLTYSKVVEGSKFEKICNFNVERNFASNFTYGNNVYCEGETEVPDYIDRTKYTNTLKGAKYTFTQDGATMRYDGIIDLHDLGFKSSQITKLWYDTIPNEFIEFLITPDDNTVKEFDVLEIKLIDIYNPDNFILFDAWSADKKYNESNIFVGMTSNAMFDSMGYDNLTLSTNGANASGSVFYGQNGTNRAHSCKLYFDPDDYISYIYPKTSFDITDVLFDKITDSSVVGLGNEWSGFTTGEVYLELTAKELLASKCSVTILSVGGHKIGVESGGGTKISVLTGDLNGDGDLNDVNNLPYAVATSAATYPVFDSIAYAASGGILNNVETKVYYDNAGELENVVVCEKKFKTDKAGDYYIDYSVDSKYGSASKRLKIKCLAEYKAEDTPNYILSEKTLSLSTAGLGDLVPVYDGKIIGGQGSWTVEKKLEYRKGAYETWIEKPFEGKDIAYFKADAPGEYKLNYTATDMLGTKIIKSHSINVAYDETPRLSAVNIPTSVIKGRAISFPMAEAQFISEAGAQDVQIKTYVDGTDYTNKLYTVNADFTVVYEASLIADSSNKSQIEYKVKAVDFDDIQKEDDKIIAYLENHFISSDLSVLLNESNNIELKVNSAKDSGFALKDYLLLSKFDFNFNLKTSKYGVAQVVFTLSDIEKSKSYTIRLINNGGKTIVSSDCAVSGVMLDSNGSEIAESGVDGFGGITSVALKKLKLAGAATVKNYVVVNAENQIIYLEIKQPESVNVTLNVGLIGVTNAETAVEILKINGAEFKKSGFVANQFLGKYFELSDVNQDNVRDFELRSEKNYLVFNTKTDKASFSFINAIPVELFDVAFYVSDELEANRFKAINVYLSDSVKAGEIVKLSVRKIIKNEHCYAQFYLNDRMITAISGSFDGSSNSPFEFTFNKRENAVYDAAGIQLAVIDGFTNGETFNGFTSGKVFMKVELEGVTGPTDIRLSKIVNQPFNYTISEDLNAPQIIFNGNVSTSTYSTIGVPYTVLSAKGYDVLSEIASCEVIVTGPKGGADIIYQGDISNDYTFTPDKIGRYTVRYVVTDTAGRRMPQKSVFLFVQEEIPPTVIVSDEPNARYFVGETYKIGDVQVSDDTDTKCEVTIFVETPTMRQNVVSVNQEIVFEEEGIYIINYYVRDKYYNRTVKTYSILVVKKEA